MFIIPLIYHIRNFRRFQVDRFLFRTKQYVLIGIIGVMLATYLILGLLLTSKLSIQFAYSLASLPFIVIILFRIFIRSVE